MSKIRFDVYTWIQKLPSSVYSFNGRSVTGGTELLLKMIPVNDNISPRKLKSRTITFSIGKRFLLLIFCTSLVIISGFVALLISFFKHF